MTRVTKFREGDIVLSPGGNEGRIVVANDEFCETVYPSPHDTRMRWANPTDLLRLLRRPVRAGDRLTTSSGHKYHQENNTWSNTVDQVVPEGIWFTPYGKDGRRAEKPAPFANYVHVDGRVPIEPPEAEEPPLNIALAADVIGCLPVSSGVAIRALYPEHVVQLGALAPVPRLPRTEDLARAVFETDPRVMAFVNRVSDWTAPGERDRSMRCEDDPRWARAMRTAWERNESGWADNAVDRASGILAVLLQGDTATEKHGP